MTFLTTFRLSTIVLLTFLFTSVHAQEEKDYFITVWDLSKDLSENNSIEFSSLSRPEVNYFWETIPAGQSGEGQFVGYDRNVKISNLPVNAKIRLKLAPKNLQRFYFENAFNWKIVDVEQWGSVSWTSMEAAFKNCDNLNITAADLPNLTGVSSMMRMFTNCNNLNGPSNINQWNVSTVVNMESMFSSKVFNQPIGNWNTQNVNNMRDMFFYAEQFNQPIGDWNTQNVVDMGGMFWEARSFDQPLGNWNTQKVNIMDYMFDGAITFNQPIGDWNTKNVTTMLSMFSRARSFNQPIGNWNTENVTIMDNMFYSARSFNQPIGNWNTSNVKYMDNMFYSASSFNQPIGKWNTQNVQSMNVMFSSAVAFNQPIGDWNTQNVTRMNYMFHEAKSFNQPLGNWNTKNVGDMTGMFFNAKSFNQRIDSLELSSHVQFRPFIKITSQFLDSCGMDCNNYSNTLIGWANNSNTPVGKEFSAEGIKYSTYAQAARNKLTTPVAQGGKGWKITGDALSSDDCVLMASQQEGVKKLELSIYPNPAQDKLFLKNASLNLSYKIIDAFGREIISGQVQNEEVSISVLHAGLYTFLCLEGNFTFVKE